MVERKWLRRVIEEARKNDVILPWSADRVDCTPKPLLLRDIKPALRLVAETSRG